MRCLKKNSREHTMALTGMWGTTGFSAKELEGSKGKRYGSKKLAQLVEVRIQLIPQ